MKQIARMISVSMLLLMCSVVMMAKSADDIVVVASVENGTVKASVTATVNGQECTLTVTPAEGYYIHKSDITVRKTISPALLGARAMSSEPKVPIAKDPMLIGDEPSDLSGVHTYTFTVDEGYGAYVTATFTARKELTDAMVKYDVNQQTYTGVGVTPIYLEDDGKTLTEGKDYTIVYENNVNATGGEPTAEATITGKSEYKGTLNPTFVIFPAQITKVEWGDDPKNPTVKCGSKVLEKGTDYDVTVGQGKVTVTGKGNYTNGSNTFELAIYTMSFADDQAWAAYCSDLNLSLPQGVTAYVITGIGETAATAEEISYIPANTAVLLHREASTTAANFTATAYSGTAQVLPTNLLKVAPAEGKKVDNAEIYVLYRNELVLASAGNLPAGRVYLPVSAEPEGTSGEDTDSRLLIVIDDEATAIENRQLPTANRSADSWYSLDGRRLDGQPAGKGVYIYKGKKVTM